MSFNAEEAEVRAKDRIACHPADDGSCWRCEDARLLLYALSLLKEAGEALERIAVDRCWHSPRVEPVLAKLRAAGVLKEGE